MVRDPLKNGAIELAARIPLEAGQQLLAIKKFSDDWAQIVGNRRDYRTMYIMLMALITLFVLFVATWIALLPGQADQRARSPRCWTPPAKCARAT